MSIRAISALGSEKTDQKSGRNALVVTGNGRTLPLDLDL